MTQHSGLTPERWAEFDLDRQVLMIGNEMHRATRSADQGREEALRRGYERVLRLTDLTAACGPRPAFLRELLRWRDVVAELYLGEPDPAAHRAAFRALLQLRPEASKQIALLLPDRPGPPGPPT